MWPVWLLIFQRRDDVSQDLQANGAMSIRWQEL